MSQLVFGCKGHTVPSAGLTLDDKLHAYYRHLIGDYEFTLEVEPMPTPRPRARVVKPKERPAFVHMYNEPDYMRYKESISTLCRLKRIRKEKINAIYVTFYMPYPKSTPKKDLINGAPHKKKPDWDNFIKGLQDGMEDAGVFLNDSAISEGVVRKAYTTKTQGFISFNLI